MNWEALIWAVCMVAFLMVESATVSMVSIWFAAGALASMTVSLFGGELWLQIVVFLAMSVALLAALRPWAKRYFTPKLTKTNTDALIGQTGRVTEDVNNLDAQGKVKFGPMEWSARSSNGEPIPVGTLVKADRIEGVKVFVSLAEETICM